MAPCSSGSMYDYESQECTAICPSGQYYNYQVQDCVSSTPTSPPSITTTPPPLTTTTPPTVPSCTSGFYLTGGGCAPSHPPSSPTTCPSGLTKNVDGACVTPYPPATPTTPTTPPPSSPSAHACPSDTPDWCQYRPLYKRTVDPSHEGFCVDFNSNKNFCGACYHACGGNQTCFGGNCVYPASPYVLHGLDGYWKRVVEEQGEERRDGN
ncbi:hypothetical protein BCR34DRAFT_575725 [Clohesyomyces aquaticus]|uniref:Uncharacterized protein n=1 Tax=Clohesyomyces aquaticus TaxID=1231657 RepID=A0A1Y1YQZ6_9PLEO|nr:hypothetical protein BCR34DRAFT_575725 [Clohesyomyces aquaticus]